MENILNNLNIFLSDLNVFYRKLQNYHWNICGKDFFVVHSKLEEYYTEINDEIDKIAEHILTLGGQPLGSLKDYLNVSKITEASNEKVNSNVVFYELVKDYSYLLQMVRNIKTCADSDDDFKTSAMMDNFIDNYSTKIWMLNQSLLTK